MALALTIVLLGWFGLRVTLLQVQAGLAMVPAAIAVHAAQLLCSGLGWRALLPGLTLWRVVRARWVREAVNSMLPVASIGGAVAGARLLAREPGLDPATALASAAVDLTGEAIAQFLFLVCGLLWATQLPHAPLRAGWVLAALTPVTLAVAGLAAAQVLGVMGAIERLALRWLPIRLAGALTGLQARLAEIYRARARVAVDVAANFCSWSVGAFEVWLLLRGVGQAVSPGAAYVIESLGLVARSIAFAVPGGLAAQETGFVLACGLFGIPPSAGLALSLLKRVRELIVGTTGVLYWQWLERPRWR